MKKESLNILRCPEAIPYEPYDLCALNNQKVCIMNSGDSYFDTECDYYNDYLKESE